MDSMRCDFLIVGSGAGGATLAKDLSQHSKNVVVVERGERAQQLGSFRASLSFFDANRTTKIPRKSKEGVTLWRTLMAGGSTVVSCGNGTRCLEAELAELGIELEREFQEAIEAGANEYIMKPFDSEIIQAKFSQVGLL